MTIGRVIKPHGINGGLLVEYYAESPELLDRPLMMKAGRYSPHPVLLKEWHLWKDQLIITVEGCNSRSAAEQMRGQELLVESCWLPQAEDDEPYLRDLVGLEVRLPSGQPVGILEDILDLAGQEIWSIRAPEADGGYEILFPAVPDFVQDMDVDEGVAVIDPPEGLLDLYREESAKVSFEQKPAE